MQIITLTTDYGTTDYYVAELKGSILKEQPATLFVDISHEIESYDIVQAAFFLSASYPKFPQGTIHIVSVYNYYTNPAEFIVFSRNDQYFIGPNNGVYSLIFEDLSEDEVFQVASNGESLTNIYSKAIDVIVNDRDLTRLGTHISDLTRKMGIQPVITSNQIRATIIHIDHYENVIVNLKKELFEKVRNNRPFSIYYKQTDPIQTISKHYGDVEMGETLSLFNSAGYMEIAVNMGKASTMYNLNKDETIQIYFGK
ncbi:MAG TPA: SAM-dependent chlorinase/fluorinase [Saprospiraceae bacterium]|nr:SAM-dependent chlorinase/fluorinase [Saprospiraceae bacterium]